MRWSHNQDSKAHPTNRFSGNVNIQTNDYQSLNQNDAQSVLQNQLSSNISFSKSFPGRPYNLTMSMSHSQNTATNKVQINLPVVNFQMSRIYPFKSKKSGKNKESWYEKISMQYTGKAQNRFLATDSTLLSSKTLRDAQYAARHDISTNASFRVLKYFNLTPNASYNETWYFKTIEKNFDPTTVYQVDTIFNPNDPTDFSLDSTIVSYGQVNTDTLSGFKALRQFNMGISMNTQIFGTMLFKKGWLRGIRHVIKPSISFNYTPNYTDPKWGYFDYVQTDSREDDELMRYTIFEGGMYGTPSSGGRQMALNYSFNNIFEGKYFSKKDTIEKKFKLFDNIIVSGNHNFAADSLKWSQVRVSGTTRFFKGLSTLALSAIWDPYTINEEGRRINVFYQKETGKLLRFVNANARLNTSISISKLKTLFKKPGSRSSSSNSRPTNPREPTTTNRGQTNDDLLGFFDGFSLNHSFVIEKTMLSGIDTLLIRTNNVSMRGNIPLTKGWAVRVGNIGYDFKTKRITYPDLGFTRDLHCWQMGMNWQPQRGTYQFYLRVKPGSLDFLEVPVKKNNADAFGGF